MYNGYNLDQAHYAKIFELPNGDLFQDALLGTRVRPGRTIRDRMRSHTKEPEVVKAHALIADSYDHETRTYTFVLTSDKYFTLPIGKINPADYIYFGEFKTLNVPLRDGTIWQFTDREERWLPGYVVVGDLIRIMA